MGKYYDQAVLRGDFTFGEILDSVILDVAVEILDEAESTPYHAARVAMAREILETSSQRRADFRSRLLLEAVRHDPIRSAAVSNGKVSAERVPDDVLVTGVWDIWNQTTLAVWPSVLEDVGA